MATETFAMTMAVTPSAVANGNTGPIIWPATPPSVDPVSGGTLKLWQFRFGSWSLTEIYQTPHVALSVVDEAPTYGSVSLTTSANNLSGLLGPLETAAQTNFMVVKNYNPGGNSQLMGTWNSTNADGGFGIFRQSGFAGIRVQSRGILNASGSNGTDTIDTSAISESSYVCVGVAHAATSRVFNIQNVGNASRAAVTYTRSTPARGVCVGNNFSNTWNRTPTFTAFAQVDAAYNLSQIQQVCEWLSEIERDRGVPVY